MKDKLQGTSQQVLKKDGTIKNWDEDIDPRVIRDRYELFIHEDFPEVDLEEEFDNTFMRIHDGGFKRHIIIYQAEGKNAILRSKRRRGWVETEDCNLKEEELNKNWNAIGPRMIDFGHITLHTNKLKLWNSI